MNPTDSASFRADSGSLWISRTAAAALEGRVRMLQSPSTEQTHPTPPQRRRHPAVEFEHDGGDYDLLASVAG